MPTEETEVQALEEAETIKNPEVLTEIIDVAKVTIEEEKIALAAIAKEEKTEPIEEVKKTEYTIPDSFVNPETGNTKLQRRKNHRAFKQNNLWKARINQFIGTSGCRWLYEARRQISDCSRQQIQYSCRPAHRLSSCKRINH